MKKALHRSRNSIRAPWTFSHSSQSAITPSWASRPLPVFSRREAPQPSSSPISSSFFSFVPWSKAFRFSSSAMTSAKYCRVTVFTSETYFSYSRSPYRLRFRYLRGQTGMPLCPSESSFRARSSWYMAMDGWVLTWGTRMLDIFGTSSGRVKASSRPTVTGPPPGRRYVMDFTLHVPSRVGSKAVPSYSSSTISSYCHCCHVPTYHSAAAVPMPYRASGTASVGKRR